MLAGSLTKSTSMPACAMRCLVLAMRSPYSCVVNGGMTNLSRPLAQRLRDGPRDDRQFVADPALAGRAEEGDHHVAGRRDVQPLAAPAALVEVAIGPDAVPLPAVAQRWVIAVRRGTLPAAAGQEDL